MGESKQPVLLEFQGLFQFGQHNPCSGISGEIPGKYINKESSAIKSQAVSENIVLLKWC